MPNRLSVALLRLNCVFFLATSHVKSAEPDYLFPDSEQDLFIKQHSEFFISHPEKVDSHGKFISYALLHHFTDRRHKRDLSSEDRRVYYKLKYDGRELTLNLTTNDNLLSNEYVLERRNGSSAEKWPQTFRKGACHLIGTVTDDIVQGTAAISTCEGLRGLLYLPDGLSLIEPVRGHVPNITHPQHPHVIYRSSTWRSLRRRRNTDAQRVHHSPCGVKDGPQYSQLVDLERERWEQEQRHPQGGVHNDDLEWERPRRISPRSISKERWVETMVVGDSKLVDYHWSGNVESYIFTIMNMVAGIFHDASIGNAIHIVLVRLILLHGEEKGLKIVHHADTTLTNFCTWQKNLNPQSDTHPAHHDVAILITRKDICAGMNQPCETLGLSHLSGMCQPHRSCNINEDSGLPVAFTIAHELGHSFGIHHDGQGNDCEFVGRHPFIMSRQLHYDSSPLTWSSCSKEYITRFLDRGWGFCLDDRPSKRDLTTPVAAPGVRYTPQHQCQLQYGPNATFCSEVDNVCQILWCSVNGSCRSKLDSPIDGTRCGPDKWCISGECVIVGKLPKTVNGGWGPWSEWSHCSRTCGAGVQSADRECNQPKPEFGGIYCMGKRKRYRICNTKPCARKHPSFREMQCSEFNTVPYHNELYEWIPVASTSRPCELYCKPVDEDFSEKMLEAVTDGTPCFMNNNSRNICVNGVCKEVGCDFGIDSNAKEDSCGVCLGDGSTCETVKETFVKQDGFGYVDLVLIPEGARDIFIQEVEEAGNFLAIRVGDSEEYYLNGNYIIQWNGEYEAGGTKFYYDRRGNAENLTSAGPTTEPVMIQLLFQEQNPGVKYEYTIKKSRPLGNEIPEPEYTWKYGAWTDCSTSCGIGVQHQPVRCFEAEVGVVEETLCDPSTRPDDRHRKCKNMDCPARWWVGGWQTCSATCGPNGVRKRTILCVRTVVGEERVLHPGDCKQLLKPKPVVPCNRDVPCGSEWAVGNWSECSLSCNGGIKSRIVKCVAKQPDRCNPANRPRSTIFCKLQSCSSTNRWTGSPFRPRFRPRVPPTIPTQAPGIQPGTPESSTTIMPPNFNTNTRIITHTRAFPMATTITTSDIIHEDDQDFILVRDGNKDKGDHEPVPTDTKDPSFPEDEEGSTDLQPPEKSSRYMPGYDYIVEDTSGEERATEDNMFTSPFPVRSSTDGPTTQTPVHTTHPTLNRTLIHTNIPTTKSATTSRSQYNVHLTDTKTPDLITITTPKWESEPRSPYKTNTTTNPRSESVMSHVSTRSPQPTVPTVKILRKTSHILKSPNKGKVPKVDKLKPEMVSTTNDYRNLNAQDPISRNAYWEVGNWSDCSTTCGLGAVWRSVVCNSEREEDCASVKKPEPARRCNLRPCATWMTGDWTNCPEGCVSDMKHRDVQCIDTQSRRPLRPFHCQVLSYKPPSSLPCYTRPCLQWKYSLWGKCSKSCGQGLKKRLVYCPEYQRCNITLKPNSTESCSLQPCTSWTTETWSQCSRSCGGGVRKRAVRCVNEESGDEEKTSVCAQNNKPDTVQICNPEECKPDLGLVCKKNSMSTRFCEKLELLGRCSLRSIRKQCCVTCMM
ncbi:A disintegrin and metalloproteinase with thrombospondin motifs 12-like [Myxocyprinus asiaticus]|uniref:A disintegrin and metalloproteinase with thrombospondin motifs 12-like n=1 Tax=Myxocyprinus asiaticus TaxID=70543 RepID=UPI0022225EA0|nr:A disintegrin and metalloproteinase with thrombospondin motifs 12-like [Myxocyprinus asiaticus]